MTINGNYETAWDGSYPQSPPLLITSRADAAVGNSTEVAMPM